MSQAFACCHGQSPLIHTYLVTSNTIATDLFVSLQCFAISSEVPSSLQPGKGTENQELHTLVGLMTEPEP